jgi:hypothetical protein
MTDRSVVATRRAGASAASNAGPAQLQKRHPGVRGFSLQNLWPTCGAERVVVGEVR